MNKTELINAVAEKSELSKAKIGLVLNALLEEISETLARGDSVCLPGFGTFKTMPRSAREGRNPQTGKKIKIKATTVPKFSPGTTLKEAVAKKKKKK